ncbi:uncharacterized protein TRIADDRAFT_56180 [Trichoplax adhaerens]|uniref:Ig-like domain-containing protein n=1 Tax=Trichoplax adhaerens TaxID=10228 RepID=B3RXE4_TRIAD|nr:hypothetical protein TRIADDRAFT_56180 [Trichoplax adhaerens]EDV24852.1 hypothetical protein TRIADDRAFT_56180 [Trichoplax adhaerens]|eukprot:XP_002112742.1 hypothetical protein TRIADDRAFT_56180 [Trichoplax adhaerens]
MKIKFRTIILIITIYYLLLWPLSSEALKTSVTNFGKKFYLGYMQAATTNQHGSHFPFVVITTLNQAAQVTITNNYDKSISLFSISAQSYREIPLPISLENSVNGVSSKTVLVTSDQDIIVEGYHVHPLSADGYLALPTTAFGKQYVIATYTPYQRSQFLVTASQDQTQLSIIFPRNVNYLGTIYSRSNHLIVNLQKSQSFYFGYNQDITGTIINSNKKVAVQSGNRCALVPVRIIDCEYLVEQLLPTNSLGKNYVLTTFADRTAGDIFRVVAAYDNTSIRMHLNGQIHIISQGSFLEFHLASDTGTYLTCSKPCAVAQYSKGQNADHSISDPMMILVPSISQYQSSYVFYSVDTDGDEIIDRFVNIAILDSQKNGLRLDGSALQHVRWVTVQTSNGTYAVAHVFIHGGRHVLNHNSSSVQFSLIQYGYGPIGLSFGFLAGIKLSLELDDYLYINQHPSSKNVSEGQTVILRCRASSNYQQINVIWLKGSTHISNYTTTNSNGESQLTLPKVAEKDIGWYRCRFSNPAGLNETESAYVDVFEIPRIVINPQNVQVNQGSSTNFHCKGEGLPTPTCIWLKNQVTINSTRYLILSSSEIKLQLNNVVIGDAGNYVCFCSNGIGNATSSIATLTVLSKLG